MKRPLDRANELVESQIKKKSEKLKGLLDADVLAYSASLMVGADDLFRDAIESIKQRKNALFVILETDGGYIEVAERIVNLLRHHYPARVEFIVASHAMSAGTVLVMSGDAIHMDYFSILGPIDPQVSRSGDARPVPALGYLEQYNKLLQKEAAGTLTTMEATILIEKFDQAELHLYEQARELSVTLLKKWLTTYKFKNWDKTATRGVPVDGAMKQARAEEIARKLNNTKLWHSHSRGIPIAVLRDELNIKIEDFGEKPELSSAIRGYHKLLMDYTAKLGASGSVHVERRFVPIA